MAVLSFLGNFYFLSAVLVLLLVALALAIVVLIRVWRSDTHPISTSDYYVTLRPARTEVVLRPAEHTDILTAPLTIENKTRGRVAFVFKVPAEVIDAYGVRPLSGTLEQGSTLDVIVYARTDQRKVERHQNLVMVAFPVVEGNLTIGAILEAEKRSPSRVQETYVPLRLSYKSAPPKDD